MDKKKPYTPWHENYYKAFFWCLPALVFLAVAVFLYKWTGNRYLLFGGMMAVVPFYYCATSFDGAMARIFGLEIEKKARADFIEKMPENWACKEIEFIKGVGNIDMLVLLPNNESCVVDIKARTYADFRWGEKDKTQAQMKAVRAQYGVIWLPRASKASLRSAKVYGLRGAHQMRNIFILAGNSFYLRDQIRDFVRDDISISFPAPPSQELLRMLKSKGFKWKKEKKCWQGNCARVDFQEMRQPIKKSKGKIEYLRGFINV